MAKRKPNYRSYLLRLWRDETPGSPWRAMLEEVGRAGKRRHFEDLESLALYLLQQQHDGPEKESGPV